MAEGGLGGAADPSSTESCGCCGQAGPGPTSPTNTPRFQTCHRRFQYWVRSGVITKIMTALASQLTAIGAIDVREAFIHATFAPRKKGAQSRKNEAWQGNKDHGRRRSQRVASFCLHRECHSPRSDASCVHLVKDGCWRRRRTWSVTTPTTRTASMQNCHSTALKSLPHIVEPEGIRLRMDVGWSDIDEGGRSSGCLAGCRTSDVWSLDMNVTPRTFSGCFSSPRL